ncbi:His Kinase A (phospho-acceptor) domain-containing protein [Filimonas lacunae]|uniref:histidine kinase n=1 Tax=Filimonas lacunae TaxID=477680 RepID=A0A173MEQ1_9BACT|nr:response regulator [Filimonas lacunae]BAV06083.1 response regulator receiver sensor signal transduction histidine kinase [Filimonas lacunae]SIT24574.1 His Kinase A (phospho-acceptor) domain-containing protein [Filimonas lacunae]
MILIVDDRQENIYSLQKILELNHFEVDSATSGEDALKKILKNTYELIILDVQMPGMDGFEVAEAIKGYSRSKDVPIIFLSAVNIEKKFIAKGYTSGGIDYIAKPFDPDILLLKVKTFCRLQQQTNELNAIHKTLREEIEFRKQAESDLSQSVDELRSILESIPQIAFTANAGGAIEFINQHWYQYSRGKEVLPKTAPGEVSVADCIREAIASGNAFVSEISIRALDQQQYRFHTLTMTPIRKNGQIVKWVGMFTDIHEQKMANQLLEQRVTERTVQLQNMNNELEATNHELQQFAYVASHDLKEPLRKIHFFSDLIKTRHLKENPDAIADMDKIIRSSERMRSLIMDILDYSKVSVPDTFEPANINGIINDILADMEMLITEKQAVIEVQNIPQLDVNPAQIRQVFQNILSNAIKFSRPHVPPLITVEACLVADKTADSPPCENGRYCRIEIADNGIGFNEKYLDKIFVIFQRLNSKEEYEGTGIGLAIVKKIVDTHKGIITASSTEGAGSRFVIVLPVHQNDHHLS